MQTERLRLGKFDRRYGLNMSLLRQVHHLMQKSVLSINQTNFQTITISITCLAVKVSEARS